MMSNGEYCSTGQSPQQAVAPTEEEEEFMMSSSDEEELLLLLALSCKRKRKWWWMHEINEKKECLGKYHCRCVELQSHKGRFFKYFHMS